MADKKFWGVSGPVVSDIVSEDYETAERFDKLKVGKRGVYFRDGFRTRFLAYGDFERAFIRIHEVNGKLCCGKAVFQYFRMVFVRDGKEYADLMSEDEKAMDRALALIAERSPSTLIGFPAADET